MWIYNTTLLNQDPFLFNITFSKHSDVASKYLISKPCLRWKCALSLQFRRKNRALRSTSVSRLERNFWCTSFSVLKTRIYNFEHLMRSSISPDISNIAFLYIWFQLMSGYAKMIFFWYICKIWTSAELIVGSIVYIYFINYRSIKTLISISFCGLLTKKISCARKHAKCATCTTDVIMCTRIKRCS